MSRVSVMPSRGASAFSTVVGEQKCNSSTTISAAGLVRNTPLVVAVQGPIIRWWRDGLLCRIPMTTFVMGRPTSGPVGYPGVRIRDGGRGQQSWRLLR
jgi:hypothetical protein